MYVKINIFNIINANNVSFFEKFNKVLKIIFYNV
jgi:hypothetical protein